jgi:hypothetical protein
MFEENDLKVYAMLKNLLSKASYDLKGDAVTTAASLFSWYERLGVKIKEDLKKQKEDADKKKKNKRKIVEKKEAIKKIGE